MRSGVACARVLPSTFDPSLACTVKGGGGRPAPWRATNRTWTLSSVVFHIHTNQSRCIVRLREIGTGISEASKRVPVFLHDVRGGKQVSSYFGQECSGWCFGGGGWVRDGDITVQAIVSQSDNQPEHAMLLPQIPVDPARRAATPGRSPPPSHPRTI